MNADPATDLIWKILESRDLALAAAREQRRDMLNQWSQTQREFQQTHAALAEAQMQLQQNESARAQTQALVQDALIETQAQLQRVEGALAQERNTCAQLYQQLANERCRVAELQDQLQTISLARARLIQEIRQSNEHLKHQIQELSNRNSVEQQRAQELEQVSQQLRIQLQTVRSRLKKARTQSRNLNTQNQELSRSVEHLERELATLSTGKGALRHLLKKTLRKLGLFDFAYSRYRSVVPLYNTIFRDQWQPATIANAAPIQRSPSPTLPDTHTQPDTQPEATQPMVQPATELQASQEEVETADSSQRLPVASVQFDAIDMESASIEAFVVARHLGWTPKDTHTLEELQPLVEFLASTRHVLCIDPSVRALPLLQSLARQGAKVTCVGCSDGAINKLQSYGLEASSCPLGEWMIYANTVSFSDYDAICLEPETVAENGPLLQARLSAETKIVFCGNTASDSTYQPLQFFDSAWDENCSEPGIGIYSHPPASWVDPVGEQRPVDEHLLWPWNRQALKLPSMLPSGKPWPKISVITVSYNQGTYLEETIRSVILQGYPNLEYIIIDGGSTDNTLEILQRYDSYLSYWVSEPDEGQSNALNKGFRKATGDILAWLNSDDCYLPETLLRVAITFDRYATDMVAGGCELRLGYNPTPFKVHHTALPVGQDVHLPLERLLDIEQGWQTGEFFYQPEVFWTRELWQRAGGYVREDLFYSMDYELWLRMANHNARIVHIPDSLARYRVHHEQKTYGDDIPYLPELKQVSSQFQRNSAEV